MTKFEIIERLEELYKILFMQDNEYKEYLANLYKTDTEYINVNLSKVMQVDFMITKLRSEIEENFTNE